MGIPIAYQDQIAVIVCAKCAMSFGVPARFEENRRNDHKPFYCPAGHSNFFAGKSKEERLQEDLAKAERTLAWTRESLERANQATATTEARRRGEKAAKTRLRNRIAAGNCPCCSEHFANLEQHISNAHPTFKADDPEAAK